MLSRFHGEKLFSCRIQRWTPVLMHPSPLWVFFLPSDTVFSGFFRSPGQTRLHRHSFYSLTRRFCGELNDHHLVAGPERKK